MARCLGEALDQSQEMQRVNSGWMASQNMDPKRRGAGPGRHLLLKSQRSRSRHRRDMEQTSCRWRNVCISMDEGQSVPVLHGVPIWVLIRLFGLSEPCLAYAMVVSCRSWHCRLFKSFFSFVSTFVARFCSDEDHDTVWGRSSSAPCRWCVGSVQVGVTGY